MPRLTGGLGRQQFGIGLVVPAKPYTFVERPTIYNPLARLGAVGEFALGQQIAQLTPPDTTHVIRDPLYIPRYPVVWYRDWVQNLLDTTLTPAAPPAAPFSQKDWPLSFAQVPASNLRVWTQSYSLNLIGQDRLPAGEVVTDLTPRPYEHHVQLRSWAWNYNLRLVGKDRFPPGGVTYDLPPRAPQQPAQTWTWNYNLNLIGKDRLPAGEIVTDLPRQLPIETRTWLASLNPQLVVTTSVLPIEVVFDLPQQLPRTALTWTQNLLETTLAPSAPPPDTTHVLRAPLLAPRFAIPFIQTWIANVSLALTAAPPVQLFMPGVVDWGTSEGPVYWDQFFAQSRVSYLTRLPFNQYDWPLARAAQQAALGFTASYNLNLIGKDRLPTGEAALDLPRQLPIDTRSWIASLNPVLLVAVPVGESATELPIAQRQPAFSFTASYNLNLVGKDKLPAGEAVTDLAPRASPAIFQTWVQSVSLALTVAPAVFPAGKSSTALPPDPRGRDAASWAQNLLQGTLTPPPTFVVQRSPLYAARPPVTVFQTWIQSVNLALTVPPVQRPFNQYDWPLSFGPRQPAQSFTGSYNLNLIGKDQLPVGEVVTDLTPPLAPAIFQTWVQSVNLALTVTPPVFPAGKTSTALPAQPPRADIGFTESFNLSLIGKDQLPTGESITDLPPQLVLRAIELRTWIQSVNLALTVTPPVKPFNQTDWPNARGAQQPALGFAASFNLNLIGKDQLPNGEIVTDLAPRGPLTPVQLYTWLQTVNLALVAPPSVFPVGKTSLGLPTLRLVFTAPQDLPPQNIVILGPPTPPVVVPPGGGGELRYRWRWCDFTDREWFKAFCEEFYRLKRLKSPEFRRQQLADLEQALDLAIERAVGGSGEPEWTFDIRTAGGMLQDEIGSSDAFDRIASGLARLALEIDDEEAFLLLGS